MKTKITLIGLLAIGLSFSTYAQKNTSLSITVSVDEALKTSFKPEGRLFIFLSLDSMREPRTQTWPNPSPGHKTFIFAKNFTSFSTKGTSLTLDDSWQGTPNWSLKEVPKGTTYYVQLLWDQDTEESRVTAPGNLYTEKQKVVLNEPVKLTLTLDQKIAERQLVDHPLLKEVTFKSDTLSSWWDKKMTLKAAVLLPHNYDENKVYPIRYNVAGYGGRYNRVNWLVNNKEFMNWWDSEEAPQVINVFLDGEGPFGDSYQMDSENSGPYGYSLIHELIPYIESTYRGADNAKYRFVDGCSTGGWVSLGLQLYYPETFNGVFSYSPDAIEFENYQLINIYKDDNAFTNEFGYPRPVMRGTDGEPMLSLKDFIQYENVLGASGTYLNSGGQFSAHTALYSPKGENGLPQPMFDPKTGEIDHKVAEHWKKYDFKLYAKENWKELGPKIQGKVYVWMGDMDHFYLNMGTRAFDEFLKTTENPKSDAVIEFTPMQGHCQQFSHKKVIEQIAERIAIIDKK